MSSIDTLEKIAKIFNVEVKELYNFQHFNDETYLKKGISEIILTLNKKELPPRI